MLRRIAFQAGAPYPPAMTVQPTESILIVDFGSQVTQLIARRIREAGVYSEIVPFNAADEAFERLQPKGIILSGGPSSVMWQDSPRAPQHRARPTGQNNALWLEPLRSEEHTSELQSLRHLVCRLLLEKK